jgi:hypothetical protein
VDSVNILVLVRGKMSVNTTAMATRFEELSPALKARIVAVLCLVDGVAAPFAEFFVRGKLVVYGDAAATATNILRHQTLYRLAGCGKTSGAS